MKSSSGSRRRLTLDGSEGERTEGEEEEEAKTGDCLVILLTDSSNKFVVYGIMAVTVQWKVSGNSAACNSDFAPKVTFCTDFSSGRFQQSYDRIKELYDDILNTYLRTGALGLRKLALFFVFFSL